MARTPAAPLTPEQEAEALRLAERMHTASKDDFLHLARLLVAKPDCQLFGATEFQVRDQALQIAARAFQTALDGREKKRLPGIQHSLPALWGGRQVRQAPTQGAAGPAGPAALPPRLLPLRPLPHRLLPLGRPRRPDPRPPHPGRRGGQ